ncbi:MAG: hypothetical protein PHX78_03920 [bacterium]|nr:hypothetical protein [bacterium]
MYSKKNIVMFITVLIFSVTCKVFAGTSESVANAKNAVQSISETSFKNGDIQLKTACLDDIEGVISTLAIAVDETEISSKNSLYQDAINTVNKLVSKTDGCIKNGNPDNEDWVINCEDASVLYNVLKQLESDINALIK